MQTTKTNPTVIHMLFPGDKPTGIPDGHANVKFDFDIIDGSPVVREKVREEMASAFSSFAECDEVGVRFSDECPDCGKIGEFHLVTGRVDCKNKNFISNAPAEQMT